MDGIPGNVFSGSSLPLNARLLLRLITIRRIRSLILQNMDFGVRVPLSLKLRAWRHWFGSKEWLLFDLDHNDPEEYIPHHASLDYAVHNANFRSLNDKLLFARSLASIGVAHPQLLAFVIQGHIHPFDNDGKGSPSPGAWIAEQTAMRGGIVLKPVIGLSGSGLLFIQASAERFTANGTDVTTSQLDELAAGLDQYLITEQVTQASYAAAIFPHTTNTLRILTLWDYEANHPFVAAAAHRFGSSRSQPVDNFHDGTGGLCANIDIASGMLGAAMTLDELGNLCKHYRHPETGAVIAGMAVPMWPEVLATVLCTASAFAEAPFVGWDIALSEKGPVFIEGNVPPSLGVWQIHGGLLKNPKVRAFFEIHGMIRPLRHHQRGKEVKKTAAKSSAPCDRSPSTAARKKKKCRNAVFPGGIPGNAFSGYPLPLSARLRLRLVTLRRFYALHAANRHDQIRASLPVRLRAWRHGFCNRHWLIYDLIHNNPADYVPDHTDLNFGIHDANFRTPNDKLLLYRVLTSLALAHPEPLAYMLRGRLFPFEQSSKDRFQQGAWLAREAVKRGAIVLKAVNGPSAPGLIVLQGSAHRLSANGRNVTPALLDRLLAGLDQYMICEHVEPAAYAAAVCLSAANTVRILTLWDYETNRPFVAATVHCFGNSQSEPPGSFHDGSAMIASIDLDSGRLGTAVTLSERGVRRRYKNHPESDAAIAGVVVPWWTETLAAVLHAASALPQAPFIGWEIIITEKGPSFLAGNSPPCLWIWQVHGGLFCDPRIRTFFEIHNMIRPSRNRKAATG